MRNNSEGKGHGLLGGVIVTVLVVVAVLLILAALFQAFGPMLPFPGELGAAFGLILLYAVVILAVGIGVVVALLQRWKEKQRRKLEDAQHGEDAGGGLAPAEKKGFPWGRLWLAAFLLMIFSPLLLTTHWFFFAVILLFGLPLLPVLIAAVGFCAAAEERKKEKEKGELHHAKKF